MEQQAMTLGEQVESLERGYADLLQENSELGHAIQKLSAEKRDLEDQIDINHTACQNLLDEKNEIIKAKDAMLVAQDKALANLKECNATLDHRLEQQNRRSTTSVQVGGGDPGLSHPYEGATLTYGDVRLARYIYHNLHYVAIRSLLGMEACRMLDAALRADQEVSD